MLQKKNDSFNSVFSERCAAADHPLAYNISLLLSAGPTVQLISWFIDELIEMTKKKKNLRKEILEHRKFAVLQKNPKRKKSWI